MVKRTETVDRGHQPGKRGVWTLMMALVKARCDKARRTQRRG